MSPRSARMVNGREDGGSMDDEAHPFELLLTVQEHDLRADQLRHRIEHHPYIKEIAQLHEKSVAIERSAVAVRMEQERYGARQSVIEVEVADLDRRIGEIDARLSGEAAGSFRDQAAMSNEMGSLAEHKRVLEDEELELMELLEPIEARLEEVRVANQRLHDEALAKHRELLSEQAAITTELHEVQRQRNLIAAKIASDLVAEYEKLRGHLGGIGASRLVHGMCTGCNLSLSATEIDRIRHLNPGELVHCEQCGRILVP